MIGTLVRFVLDVAKERLLSRPAKTQAVRALYGLYLAVVDCHEAYEEWIAVHSGSRWSPEYLKWKYAVHQLRKSFEGVRDVIEIYAPPILPEIERYTDVETLHLTLNETALARQPHIIVYKLKRLWQSVRLALNLRTGRRQMTKEKPPLERVLTKYEHEDEALAMEYTEMFKDIDAIDARNIAVSIDNFETVRNELRDFIRTNFEIEDLFL